MKSTKKVALGIFLFCGWNLFFVAGQASLSAQVAAKQQDPISAQETEEFVKQWLAALNSGDRKAGNELIAFKEIIDRAVKSADVPSKEHRNIAAGALGSIEGNVVGSLVDVLKSGGSYNLVRVSEKNGAPYALFRLIDSQGTFNYHLFRIQRVRGKIRADQFLVAKTGEKLGDTLSQNFKDMTRMLTGTLQEKAKNSKNLELYAQYAIAVQKEDYSKANEIYNKLPEEIKQFKMARLLHMQNFQDPDEPGYVKALDSFIKEYPNDPALAMVLLDSAAIKEDVPLLIKAHGMLDQWTGGDDYLDLLVGAALTNMGKTEKAVELTKDADPASTNVADAHSYMLDIAIAAKDYNSVLEQLRALRDNHGYVFNDLREVEGLKEFVNSPQFKTWSDENAAAKEK